MPPDLHSSNQPLSPDTAGTVLREVCRRTGMSAPDAGLVRIGDNAVYRVGPVVVRIARSVALLPAARREVAVARWLRTRDFPAAVPLDLDQPMVVLGRVVTCWEAVEVTAPATTGQLATLLRRFHELTAPPELDLPALNPFARVDHWLASAPLDEQDLDYLRGRVHQARADWADLDFALPTGVVHGDANTGNAVVDGAGRPLLLDLEYAATGPREWDLLQTALFADRFGWHTEAEYRAFSDAYGYDIRRWPGYQRLADIREVLMTCWLSARADDEWAAGELRKRLRALRTGADRHDWSRR
ncbi:phosphotransferase family protein [Actinoalloteichus caeruleus]|uniref:phosphotransferase family protein n=2 Tax=Actinoalloteichus cyanogriseus TaxID=2893586 RepID=UPI0004BE7573|nr:aminoglycoside phosphotransferase family protein [Actinoalloteichus caeruleus]